MSDDTATGDPPPDAGRSVVVAAGWTPGRAEPEHRSEMTTQWLCGEVLRVAGSQGDWLRVRGAGGYRSWVHRGGLLEADPGAAEAWDAAATARSLGVDLVAQAADGRGGAGPGAPASAPSPAPRRLPWGARAAPAGEGRIRLPGGRETAYEPVDGVVAGHRRRERFPADGEAVARSAVAWRGAPYLWGGRTPEGTDCSGFVQAVFALHGVAIPRDSGDQLAAGPRVPPADDREATGAPAGGEAGPGAGEPPSEPGDLLFFGDGPEAVTHVALAVGGSRVVHAAAANGCVALDNLSGDRRLEARLRRRLVGATRPLAAG